MAVDTSRLDRMQDVTDVADAAKTLHGHAGKLLRFKKGSGASLGVVRPDGSIRQVAGVTAKPNPTDNGDNIVDKVAGMAAPTANAAVTGAMIAPFAIPAAGSVLKWTGNKTGVESIQNAGKSVTKFTQKPFSDVFSKVPFSGKIAGGAQIAADFTGDASNKIAVATKADKLVPKFSNWRLKSHLSKAAGLLENADAHHANLPKSLQKHSQTILEHARSPVDKIDPDALETARKAFTDAAAKEKHLLPSENAAVKLFNKVGKVTSKAVGSQSSITSWQSPKSVISDLPKSIGKAPVLQGVMNAAFIGTSAMGMFSAATSFKASLSALKEMSQDITGKKSSTAAILTGNVPAPVAAERSKLMKTFAVSEVTGAVSLGLMVMSAIRGKVGMLGFIAPTAVGMGVNALIGDSNLPYYASMKKAHAAGQEIPVDAYANFVGKASPELRTRGAEGSAFSKKIAEQYAAEKASPAQVMRETANGGVMKRVNALIAANAAEKPLKAGVGAESKLASHVATAGAIKQTEEVSHVAALQGKNAKFSLPRRDRPVSVGGYTQKLADNPQQANYGLN